MTQRMHPDGVASLIAVLVAGLDVKAVIATGVKVDELRLLQGAIERRQRQVLELAREFYKVHPVDFENDNSWRQQLPRNASNNRARLDRISLR